MDVININEEIRNMIYMKYYCFNKSGGVDVYNYLKDITRLKNSDYRKYKLLISALYPVFYMINGENINNLEEFEKFSEEKDIYGNDDMFNDSDYDPDDYDASQVKVYDLDCIQDEDDLLDIVDTDPRLLIDMFLNTLTFVNSDSYQVRALINKYKQKADYFMRFSKLWLLDVIDFARPISTSELINRCKMEVDHELDIMDIHYQMLDYACAYIENLKMYDSNAYLNLVEQIMETSYKYQKFLVLMDIESNDDPYLNENVKYLEGSACEDINKGYLKDEFLSFIIDYFLEYEERDDEYKNKLNKYFEENKSKLKQLKLNYKL